MPILEHESKMNQAIQLSSQSSAPLLAVWQILKTHKYSLFPHGVSFEKDTAKVPDIFRV